MDDTNTDRRTRLRELINALNIKDKTFAEALGKRPTVISHLLTGQKNITANFAYEITKRYSWFNPEWLISGKGNMRRDYEVVENNQFTVGKPRSLEDLEAIYRADPLAGLRDLVERVARLEKEFAELKAAKMRE